MANSRRILHSCCCRDWSTTGCCRWHLSSGLAVGRYHKLHNLGIEVVVRGMSFDKLGVEVVVGGVEFDKFDMIGAEVAELKVAVRRADRKIFEVGMLEVVVSGVRRHKFDLLEFEAVDFLSAVYIEEK